MLLLFSFFSTIAALEHGVLFSGNMTSTATAAQSRSLQSAKLTSIPNGMPADCPLGKYYFFFYVHQVLRIFNLNLKRGVF